MMLLQCVSMKYSEKRQRSTLATGSNTHEYPMQVFPGTALQEESIKLSTMNDTTTRLAGAETTTKYLQSDNDVLKRAVEKVTLTVHASANQAMMEIEKSRERISDATDHLDGVFVSTINISQAAEIVEITKIAEELNTYFDKAVHQRAFKDFSEEIR